MKIKFRSSHNNNLKKKNKIVINYLSNILRANDIKKYFEVLESNLRLPKKIILFFFKKKIFENFNHKDNSLTQKIKITTLIKYSILSFVYVLINFFQINYNKKKLKFYLF